MNGVRFLAIIVILTLCLAKNYLDTAPTNIALHKPSSQSSTYDYSGVYYLASRANDGDLATRAQTENTNPSWWFVDLKEQIHVTFIRLKLEEPWHNLHVGVGNKTPTDTSAPGKDFKVCKEFTGFPGDWIQRIPCNITGRYVIVYSVYIMNLVIVEVEVYNTPEPGDLGLGQLDLARNKSLYLSSTLSGNYASKGNDGNPFTWAPTNYSASLPAYWYVNLEGRFQVTSIVLYYSGHWTHLTVGVGDNPLTSTSRPGEDFRVCHVFTGYQDDALQNIACSIPGRYVIIFSKASSKLRVNEIEVYGTPVSGTTENYPITTVTTKNTEVGTSWSSFFMSKDTEARSTATPVPGVEYNEMLTTENPESEIQKRFGPGCQVEFKASAYRNIDESWTDESSISCQKRCRTRANCEAVCWQQSDSECTSLTDLGADDITLIKCVKGYRAYRSCDPGCSWVEKRHTHGIYYRGALASYSFNLDECKAACLKKPFCEALSWMNKVGCFLHPPRYERNTGSSTALGTYIEFGAECQQTTTENNSFVTVADKNMEGQSSKSSDYKTSDSTDARSTATPVPGVEYNEMLTTENPESEIQKRFGWMYYVIPGIVILGLAFLVCLARGIRKPSTTQVNEVANLSQRVTELPQSQPNVFEMKPMKRSTLLSRFLKKSALKQEQEPTREPNTTENEGMNTLCGVKSIHSI